MILGFDIPNENMNEDPNFLSIYKEAVDLYGVIHSRYLLTQRGL